MPAPARVADLVKFKSATGIDMPAFVTVVLPNDAVNLVAIRLDAFEGVPGLYALKNVPYGSAPLQWRWLNE